MEGVAVHHECGRMPLTKRHYDIEDVPLPSLLVDPPIAHKHQMHAISQLCVCLQ